jgi:plastocyanin
MATSRRLIEWTAALLAAAGMAACGSDGGDIATPPTPPAALSAARSEPSGNGQSGTAGQDLASPVRIVVLRGAAPEPGAVVTWTATGAGATMTPRVDTTGADGVSASIWHLGSGTGSQSSQAAVAGGADGSPVIFAATAVDPGAPQPPQPPPPPPPTGVVIQLLSAGGNRFQPANVTIAVGTTVTWTWVGGFHDVTAAGNPGFPSSGVPVLAPNTFSQTFSSAGTYLYFCSVHGSPTNGMRGTIVVQ